MIKLSIILFREFLEISLIVNIIAASTQSIVGSRLYISIGLFFGAIISLLFGYFTAYIASSFDGIGEELLNVITLLLTSFAILWTIIWMKIEQGKIKSQASDIANKISENHYQKIMISFIVASSVIREFTEIALFSYGIISSSNIKTYEYILSLLIGGSTGLLFGLIIYQSLKSIAKKYLFKIFSILLLLISASMASEAAKILNSSGIILWLCDPIWNTSNLISDTSVIANILKLLSIGYSSSPSIMEAIFYMIPIIIFLIFSRKTKN
jgi:high-affinity iron transporter